MKTTKSKTAGVLFEDEKFRKERVQWTQGEQDCRIVAEPDEGGALSLWEGEVREQRGEHTDGGQVTVALPRFLELLRVAATPADTTQPVQNFVVSEARYSGVAGKKDHGVELRVSLRVTILTPRWTCVQLLPDKIAISNAQLVPSSSRDHSSTTSSSTTTTTSTASTNENRAYIGVRSGAHCLFAYYHPGEYKLQLQGRCPYQTSRARGVIFNIPYAVLNTLEFSVPERDIEIVATPCLAPKLSQETVGSSAGTKLVCNIPASSELSVQWSERIEEEEVPVEQREVPVEKEVIVTVEQLTLHSVSEGAIVRV